VTSRLLLRDAVTSNRGIQAVLLGAALVVLWRQQGAFGFYEDEGLNLLKGFMVAAGHPLYSSVYSDQPPLFTWILALAIRLFGADYHGLRFISLFSGWALLAGAMAVAGQMGGSSARVVTVVFLLACAPFLKFGSSILITTPALALGVWAIYFALRFASQGSRRALAASGYLLGFGAITKLAVLYLFPVVILALASRATGTPLRRRIAHIVIWCSSFALPLAVAVIVTPASHMIWELVLPHIAGFRLAAQQAARARREMLLAPGMESAYAAGVVGLLVAARADPRRGAFLLVWLLDVVAWMLIHRPLWEHHLPDLLVPLAICAGAGSAGLRPRVESAGVVPRAILALTPRVLVTIAFLSQLFAWEYWRNLFAGPSEASLRKVASALMQVTSPQDWVLVDRPSIAFFARRRVPPSMVLIATKRIASGDLTDRELLEALDQYKPAAVVLCTELLCPFRAFQTELERRFEPIPQRFAPDFGLDRCELLERTAYPPSGAHSPRSRRCTVAQ
jgi:hypothetical protein